MKFEATFPLACASTMLIVSCATEPPQVPGKENLPVKEITNHIVCEIFKTFTTKARSDGKYYNADDKPRLDLSKLQISITLTPTTYNDSSFGLGGTLTNNPKLGAAGGSTTNKAATNSAGASPGIETLTATLFPGNTAALEQKGEVQSSVTYNLHTGQFFLTPGSTSGKGYFDKLCDGESLHASPVEDFRVLATALDSPPETAEVHGDGEGFEAWFNRVLEPLDNKYLSMGNQEAAKPPDNATLYLQDSGGLSLLMLDAASENDKKEAQTDFELFQQKIALLGGVTSSDEIATFLQTAGDHITLLLTATDKNAKKTAQKNYVDFMNSVKQTPYVNDKLALAKTSSKSSGASTAGTSAPLLSYQTELTVTWDAGVGLAWTPQGLNPHVSALGPTLSGQHQDDVIVIVNFATDTNPNNTPSAPVSGVLYNSTQFLLLQQKLP